MLDAVGVVSKDLKKTKKFYKLLGVDLVEEGGSEHLEYKTSSGVRLMVDSVELTKKLNPNWKKSLGSGPVLCFKQTSSEKVDKFFLDIEKFNYGVIHKPWDAFWGQRYASVLDPDGNQVDLFADLES